MKKILVVCQHFWPESFRINDICEYLVDNEYEIDVLCGIPNYPKGKFYEGYSYCKKRKELYKGMTIYRAIEIPRGRNKNINIFLNYISYPLFSLFKVPRFLFKKYDKVFIYQTSPVLMGLPGIIIGKLKKIEITTYILDLWPDNLYSVLDIKSPMLRALAQRVSNWFYKKSDKLIVLSDKMKEVIQDRINYSDERILVMPQCCEKFYEEDIYVKELEEKFKDGFKIVFAGNISPAQSFETILGAAVKLKADGIDDIKWIIVGDGMSRKWLEEQVKELDLDNFYFEGFQKPTDIPKYHTIADVLIGCLAKSDLLDCTIPAKVMSYIAAGRPIILAMDGEVQNIINSKACCGYAGNAEDTQTLYQNIRKMYSLDYEKRVNMGNNARLFHMKYFERNVNYKRMMSFIERVKM